MDLPFTVALNEAGLPRSCSYCKSSSCQSSAPLSSSVRLGFKRSVTPPLKSNRSRKFASASPCSIVCAFAVGLKSAKTGACVCSTGVEGMMGICAEAAVHSKRRRVSECFIRGDECAVKLPKCQAQESIFQRTKSELAERSHFALDIQQRRDLPRGINSSRWAFVVEMEVAIRCVFE